METYPRIDHLLFFGRFNVAHIGYLLVIQTGLQLIRPAKGITLLPSSDTPTWGEYTLPFNDRFAMLQAAIASEFLPEEQKNIHLSRLELELARQGKKTGFTIDALQAFCASNPQQTIGIVMGADAGMQLHKWKEYQQIFELSHVFIVPRASIETVTKVYDALPSQLQRYIQGENARLHVLPLVKKTTATHASSSKVLAGETNYLPQSVQSYTAAHALL